MDKRTTLGGFCLIGLISGTPDSCASTAGNALDTAHLRQRLAALSVPFVPNGGQWDRRAAFAAHTFAGTLFVTTDGQLVYRLPGKEEAEPPTELPPAADVAAGAGKTSSLAPRARRVRIPGGVLTETLVDAGGRAHALTPLGRHAQRAGVSYFIGDGASRLPDPLVAFEQVALGDVEPGIAVHLRATGRNVEKIFTIAPHRDPGTIRVRLGGAEWIALGPDGELIAHTVRGDVVYTAPVAFQEDASGQRVVVPVRYALAADNHSYGFALADYDRSRTLVIDPLLQATYFGGSDGFEQINAIAIHPVSGEVLVAGIAGSTNLPCTTVAGGCANAAQPAKKGGSDGFIARLSANLTSLLQVTYFGGDDLDQINAIAVHPVSGEIVVAGQTKSSNLPCTTTATPGCANSTQSAHFADGGDFDGFVARFSANLTSLLQATYIGGSSGEAITAIAIHPVNGQVLVAGWTNSPNLPCTFAISGCGSNGAQPSHAADLGNSDGFVARFSANLTSLLQTTYIGGNSGDVVNAIAVHPVSGEVLVGGHTGSNNLPCTTTGAGCGNGAQPANAGGWDGFIARFSSSLTSLLQVTYLGGSDSDRILALVVHPGSGEVVVAGETGSTNLPCTVAGGGCGKGAQPAHAVETGVYDGFVARYAANLTTLLQATYLGGNNYDRINAIAIQPGSGEVVVAGFSQSPNLPCTTIATPGCANGALPAHAGESTDLDGFVARLSANLTSLRQTTYLGGNDYDFITAIAIHPVSGETLVAGGTISTDLPCATAATLGCGNGAQPTGSNGTGEGFVARLSTSLLSGGCTLDVDGNKSVDALTDGLMILRAMFGLTGTSVTSNAVGAGATRASWASIQPYLNGACGTSFSP
jgi:hypothetical protein